MQLLGHVRLLVLARRRSHEISHLRDFVDLFSMPKLSSALAQLQGPAFGKPPPSSCMSTECQGSSRAPLPCPLKLQQHVALGLPQVELVLH